MAMCYRKGKIREGGKLMKQVLVVSGKAKQVFKYLGLVARYKGNVSLKELSKNQRKAS
jgi:hypothetical protein